MARLKDFLPVCRRVGFIGLCKRVWQQCNEDGVFTWASALAYSWLFAIFPFFLILLSLVPYIPLEGKEWMKDNAGPVLEKALPRDAYNLVWQNYLHDRMDTLLNQRPKAYLSVGLILTLWAASGGMAMTMRALDKCYDLEHPRPYVKVRFLAIVLTFIFASLMLVVFVALPIASTATTWVENFLAHQNPPVEVPRWGFLMFDVGRYAIALVCMILALSTLYYLGPYVRQRYRLITPGAVFCIFVWLALGALFRLYVNHFGRYQQMYGPVGGVVILLLFFYLDAVVLLIGAEINSEIDFVAYNVKPGERDFSGKPWEHEKLSAALDSESSSTG
jgi:membrane protein